MAVSLGWAEDSLPRLHDDGLRARRTRARTRRSCPRVKRAASPQNGLLGPSVGPLSLPMGWSQDNLHVEPIAPGRAGLAQKQIADGKQHLILPNQRQPSTLPGRYAGFLKQQA